MPKNSHVHKTFANLKAQGHSEESAAKIAQAVTGEALKTGKPPKNQLKSGKR
jgi:hypothetical protein